MKSSVAGAVVGAVVASAVAVVVSQSSSTVILGCVGPYGDVRIVAAPANCVAPRYLVTWNQTGPQGPQGEVGPEGPVGPPGAVSPSLLGFASVPFTLSEVTSCSGPADVDTMIGAPVTLPRG